MIYLNRAVFARPVTGFDHLYGMMDPVNPKTVDGCQFLGL